MKLPWRAVLALLALVSVGLFACLAAVPTVTADGFRARLLADLPPGTPRADVEAWLRERGIRFLGSERWPDVLVGHVGPVYPLQLLGSTVLRFTVDFDNGGRLT